MPKGWRRLKRPRKCGEVVWHWFDDIVGPCGRPALWTFTVSKLAPFYRCDPHKKFHDEIVKEATKNLKRLAQKG